MKDESISEICGRMVFFGLEMANGHHVPIFLCCFPLWKDSWWYDMVVSIGNLDTPLFPMEKYTYTTTSQKRYVCMYVCMYVLYVCIVCMYLFVPLETMGFE
jgi:hypothetical protein